jgi:hypothetical protein
MPATPLGPDRLSELLARSCRLVLTNETSEVEGATIMAAAFVLHHEDASTQTLSFYGLDLGPGGSGAFDNDRPSASPVVLVEAMIRLEDDDQAGVADAYATAAADPQRALRAVTFGIKGSARLLAPEDHVISTAPRFAVFGRPAS